MKLLVFALSVFSATLGAPTLWERIGGESKIKPLCDDLYEMHASDPLTASCFGSDVAGNIWSSEEVNEHEFTFFFSADIAACHYRKIFYANLILVTLQRALQESIFRI